MVHTVFSIQMFFTYCELLLSSKVSFYDLLSFTGFIVLGSSWNPFQTAQMTTRQCGFSHMFCTDRQQTHKVNSNSVRLRLQTFPPLIHLRKAS